MKRIIIILLLSLCMIVAACNQITKQEVQRAIDTSLCIKQCVEQDPNIFRDLLK